MPLPDGLSKLFKRGTILDLPDHKESVLRRLADLGLVTLEEYRYVKCVNPLDPDQKYASQASCTGRIPLHADWDEDDWAYQCPNCGRQVFPGKKVDYTAVSVSPSPGGMRAYVRQQLDTLGVEVEEKPEGLFRLAGQLGEIHVCLVDCCPDKSLLKPDYYNDKTVYVVGNERGHQRILRRLGKPVFGLVGLVLAGEIDAFLSKVRELAALDDSKSIRPAVLTFEEALGVPSQTFSRSRTGVRMLEGAFEESPPASRNARRGIHRLEEALAESHSSLHPASTVAEQGRPPAEEQSLPIIAVGQDCTWRDIHIYYADGHRVVIRTPTGCRRYHYLDLGFGRDNNREPILAWKLLLESCEGDHHHRNFAKYNGRVLSWDSLKKQVSCLQDRLQALFGLTAERPFYRYKKADGWRPRFHCYDRPPGDLEEPELPPEVL